MKASILMSIFALTIFIAATASAQDYVVTVRQLPNGVLCTVIERGLDSKQIGVVEFVGFSFYGSAAVARDFAGAAANRFAPLSPSEGFVFVGDVLRGDTYTTYLHRWRPMPRKLPPPSPSDIMVAANITI
jgi:hypothetical protein